MRDKTFAVRSLCEYSWKIFCVCIKTTSTRTSAITSGKTFAVQAKTANTVKALAPKCFVIAIWYVHTTYWLSYNNA